VSGKLLQFPCGGERQAAEDRLCQSQPQDEDRTRNPEQPQQQLAIFGISDLVQKRIQAQCSQENGIELHHYEDHGGHSEFIEEGQVFEEEVGNGGCKAAEGHDGEDGGGDPEEDGGFAVFGCGKRKDAQG